MMKVCEYCLEEVKDCTMEEHLEVCEGKKIFDELTNFNKVKYIDQYKVNKNNSVSNENSNNEEYDEALDEIVKEYIRFFETQFKRGIYSYSLEEQIKKQTKSKLLIIASNLGIMVSSKIKKIELIQIIIEKYPERLLNKLKFLDDTQYLKLNTFAANNGIFSVDKMKDETFISLDYFLDCGFIFPCIKDGESITIMPNEVSDIIKNNVSIDLMRSFKRNGEIVKLAQGLINSYGILDKDTLSSMISSCVDYEISMEYLEELLYQASLYKFKCKKNKNLYINGAVQQWDKLLKCIKSESENLEYKHFTKEQLIIAGSDNWLLNTTFGLKFTANMSDYFTMEDGNLEEMMSVLQLSVQEFKVEQIIRDATIMSGIDDSSIVEIFSDILEQFLKDVPLWIYKGRSLNEMTILSNQNIKGIDDSDMPNHPENELIKNKKVIKLFNDN